MSSLNSRLSSYAPVMLSVLRIMAGLLFLAHGTGKFLDFPHLAMVPPMYSMPWWGGVLELIGGVFMVLGLFTVPVSFILSGEMAVAYFIAHHPRSFFPAVNGGDAAVLYTFVFLYFAFAGGGALSLDALRGKK